MPEIERKFLLDAVPAGLPAGDTIQQAYLALSPEVRIRKRGNNCYITIKGEGDLERDELEGAVPCWAFDALWPKCNLRIEKQRHTVNDAGHTLEIDVYTGRLGGLVIMEVEFPTVDAAIAFVAPSWVGTAREVTGDKRYKNKLLARDGRPADA